MPSGNEWLPMTGRPVLRFLAGRYGQQFWGEGRCLTHWGESSARPRLAFLGTHRSEKAVPTITYSGTRITESTRFRNQTFSRIAQFVRNDRLFPESLDFSAKSRYSERSQFVRDSRVIAVENRIPEYLYDTRKGGDPEVFHCSTHFVKDLTRRHRFSFRRCPMHRRDWQPGRAGTVQRVEQMQRLVSAVDHHMIINWDETASRMILTVCFIWMPVGEDSVCLTLQRRGNNSPVQYTLSK
jgi:hypothetical protein